MTLLLSTNCAPKSARLISNNSISCIHLQYERGEMGIVCVNREIGAISMPFV